MDTNAITSMIITIIFNLDIYFHTMGNNITKFYAYFLQIIDTLVSLGETIQYLLANLFKGYGSCIDKSFMESIKQKQERYD